MSKTPVMSPNIPLEEPIKRGEQEIKCLQLRKPHGGELRGLSLVAVGQLDVNELHKLLPRIAVPTITEADVAAMDPADLLSLGAEVAAFLLPKRNRPDFLAE